MNDPKLEQAYRALDDLIDRLYDLEARVAELTTQVRRHAKFRTDVVMMMMAGDREGVKSALLSDLAK